MTTPNTPTFEQKVAAFRATADDPQKRAEYAASRAAVIVSDLEQQSTVRAIFDPETLAPGANAEYDIPFADIDCVFFMPQIGGVPTVQVETAKMHVDTFGMDGGVEYQEDIARDGRFQVGDRATLMLKNKFIALEEMAGWALIKTHAAALDSTQQVTAFKDDGTAGGGGTGKLNIYTLNETITKADGLGIGGRQVTDIYCSPRRFNDLRSQVTVSALPEELRKQLWNNGAGDGSPAGIRIHKVYNSDLVSDTKIYAFTRKDGVRYGVMPIRQALQTRDNPIASLEFKIGIIGRQRLGFGVLDSLGMIEITC